MKRKNTAQLALLLLVTVALITPEVTFAVVDSSTPYKKTPEEIEAYKQKMRAEKAGQIENFKNAAKVAKEKDLTKYRNAVSKNKRDALKVREDIKTKRLEITKNRCEKIKSAVSTRVKRYEGYKQKHVELHKKMTRKLEDAVKKLKSKGYDTTKLESDLVELNDLAKVYSSEFEYFISLLQGLDDYACDSADVSQYKDDLKAVREQLKVVHSARKDLVEFYRKNIREDIKDLRKQVIEKMKDTNANNKTDLGKQVRIKNIEKVKPSVFNTNKQQ